MNLLILGNGFDLHCTLNSRFKDFFNKEINNKSKDLVKLIYSRTFQFFIISKDENPNGDFSKDLFKKIKNTLLGMYSYTTDGIIFQYDIPNFIASCLGTSTKNGMRVEKNDLNFFTLYFILLRLNNNRLSMYNWSDVEDQLYILLDKYAYKIQPILTILCNQLNSADIGSPKQIMSDALNDVINKHLITDNANDTIILSSIFIFVFMYKIIQQDNKGQYHCKPANVYLFLFNQLKSFESSFSRYIKSISSNNKIYMANAKSILKYLGDSNHDEQNILSFNYTDLSFANKFYHRIRHVHSTVCNGHYPNGHPIIGIDSNKGNAYLKPYYMFTKTYRIMNLMNVKNNNKEYSYNILPSRKDINRIIFYGHSLGVADYSYFMAIFDYYHIYDSNVELVFYYNNYNDKDESRNQYVHIFNLINHYGASVSRDNNLLHKLILENRIHIRYLPVKIKTK